MIGVIKIGMAGLKAKMPIMNSRMAIMLLIILVMLIGTAIIRAKMAAMKMVKNLKDFQNGSNEHKDGHHGFKDACL
jgi:hypothetical protein